jgi:hypothetical protein
MNSVFLTSGGNFNPFATSPIPFVNNWNNNGFTTFATTTQQQQQHLDILPEFVPKTSMHPSQPLKLE